MAGLHGMRGLRQLIGFDETNYVGNNGSKWMKYSRDVTGGGSRKSVLRLPSRVAFINGTCVLNCFLMCAYNRT